MTNDNSAGEVPAERRGTLTIHEQVVSKIAGQLLVNIPGVGGTSRGAFGLGSSEGMSTRPRVDVALSGRSAVLSVEVGLTYPSPIRKLTEDIRQRLFDGVTRLTGITVRQVDLVENNAGACSDKEAAMSVKALRKRSARVIPAIVTAVIILAIGALVAWWAISRLLNGNYPLQKQVFHTVQSIADTTYDSPIAMAVAAVIGVIGLVMVLLAITAGSQRLAFIRTEGMKAAGSSRLSGRGASDHGDARGQDAYITGECEIAMTTSGLANLAVSAGDEIDGVERVRCNASPKKLEVAVTTYLRDTKELTEEVRSAIISKVKAAGITPVPKVSVYTNVKEQ